MNRLAEVRRGVGLTQRELADRAGVTTQHVSNIERGEAMPGVEIAIALAGALGCTVEAVFGPSSSPDTGEHGLHISAASGSTARTAAIVEEAPPSDRSREDDRVAFQSESS